MATKKKKILIVEDNTLNLKLFRDVLRAKGFDTIEDRTGQYCLEYAKLHQPDLIILDILLPFASGIELTQQLSAHDKTKHIPILGVTALAISGTLDKMVESGCVDCLIKPFTLDQMIHGVDQCISAKGIDNNAHTSNTRHRINQIKAELDVIQSVQTGINGFDIKSAQKNALNQNENNQNGQDADLKKVSSGISSRTRYQKTLF